MTEFLVDVPGLGSAEIIKGDSRDLPLEDDSVDLVITSPPYFALRSYQDGGEHYAGQIGDEPSPQEFVDSLLEVTKECVRVLKPSGSLWVNLGDKYSNRSGGTQGDVGVPTKSLMGLPWRYALRCIDELGLILRAEVIWSKPNGLPESVKDRVRRSHEQWFHFVLQPRYFSAVDEIREPHTSANPGRGGLNRRGDESYHALGGAGATGKWDATVSPLGKLPGSVWDIATQPLKVPAELGVDHFAAFPMEWPRRIIKGWSPSDGVVLDPFGGTGTTATVAKALGRHGISVDMSADYCRLAEWRTNDDKELAKARSGVGRHKEGSK